MKSAEALSLERVDAVPGSCPVPVHLSPVNCQPSTVNCQLSTVNCQSVGQTKEKVEKKKVRGCRPTPARGLLQKNYQNNTVIIDKQLFRRLRTPYIVDPLKCDVLRTRELRTFEIRGSTE